MKEKLIELYAELDQMRNMRMGIGECVDILIAEGVTIPVRCKDCKHFIQEEHGCNHFGYYSHTPWVDEVDFCSYGERKDNERKVD